MLRTMQVYTKQSSSSSSSSVICLTMLCAAIIDRPCLLLLNVCTQCSARACTLLPACCNPLISALGIASFPAMMILSRPPAEKDPPIPGTFAVLCRLGRSKEPRRAFERAHIPASALHKSREPVRSAMAYKMIREKRQRHEFHGTATRSTSQQHDAPQCIYLSRHPASKYMKYCTEPACSSAERPCR
jgi:hypothetical protein